MSDINASFELLACGTKALGNFCQHLGEIMLRNGAACISAYFDHLRLKDLPTGLPAGCTLRGCFVNCVAENTVRYQCLVLGRPHG